MNSDVLIRLYQITYKIVTDQQHNDYCVIYKEQKGTQKLFFASNIFYLVMSSSILKHILISNVRTWQWACNILFISTPYISWMHVKYENEVTCKYWILHVGEESFCCMFLWLLIVHPESYDVKNCIMRRKHFADCSNSFSNEDWVLHLSFLSKNEKIHIHMFDYHSNFVFLKLEQLLSDTKWYE